jgi:hypothetical protein
MALLAEPCVILANHSSKLRRLRQMVTRLTRWPATRSRLEQTGSLSHLTGRATGRDVYVERDLTRNGKSLAFCVKQDSENAESFARSIALCCPCFAQARGDHPWSPVERMRSTHGWLHGVPESD